MGNKVKRMVAKHKASLYPTVIEILYEKFGGRVCAILQQSFVDTRNDLINMGDVKIQKLFVEYVNDIVSSPDGEKLKTILAHYTKPITVDTSPKIPPTKIR